MLLRSVLISFVLAAAVLAQTPPRDTPRHVLLLSIDGLDTRYLHQADELGLKVPNLRRLMRDGVVARGVVSVYPTVTYPNHTSAVTGAYPAMHGIPGNTFFEAPDQPKKQPAYWYARYIKADTLWDAAKRKGVSVGLVSWPVAGGAGDWNVPETWSEGRDKQQIRSALRNEARPRGLVEEIEREKPDLYAKETDDEGDDARISFAEYLIANKKPKLMLVHIYDLDHFEHDYGPFTAEAKSILEKSDAYLGRLLAAYKQAGLLGHTAVFIISDHGFMPYTRQFNPALLLAQAGLVDVVAEKHGEDVTYKVRSWRAYPYVTSSSCGIMLRDSSDREAAEKARQTLAPYVGKPDSPILRIVDRPELKELGADQTPAFVLEAAAGYSCGSRIGGDFITERGSKGNHGYLPHRPDYMASFIASGAGVKRRGEIGVINMVDIAPSIARLLGLELKDSVGRAVQLD